MIVCHRDLASSVCLLSRLVDSGRFRPSGLLNRVGGFIARRPSSGTLQSPLCLSSREHPLLQCVADRTPATCIDVSQKSKRAIDRCESRLVFEHRAGRRIEAARRRCFAYALLVRHWLGCSCVVTVQSTEAMLSGAQHSRATARRVARAPKRIHNHTSVSRDMASSHSP